MRLTHRDIYETSRFGGLIAVDVLRRGDHIVWHDWDHSRGFTIAKVTRETDKVLEFEDTLGREHYLRVIDQANFKRVCTYLGIDPAKVKTPGGLKLAIRKSIR